MINTMNVGDIQMSIGLQKRVSLCMIVMTITVMDIMRDMVIMSGDHTGTTIMA